LTTNDTWLRGSLAGIVIIHFVVAFWHGAAHVFIPVSLTGLQAVFVAGIVTILPLVGAGLLWTIQKIAAAWLIALSMLASLLFGLINHYILDSPDNVLSVPEDPWRHSFVLSAALVAVAEAVGTVLGGIGIYIWRA
jgi:hypothetical protein